MEGITVSSTAKKPRECERAFASAVKSRNYLMANKIADRETPIEVVNPPEQFDAEADYFVTCARLRLVFESGATLGARRY